MNTSFSLVKTKINKKQEAHHDLFVNIIVRLFLLDIEWLPAHPCQLPSLNNL